MGVALALAGSVAAGVAVWAADQEAQAHGSVQRPASRAYSCRFEQPDNPMCAAAWTAGSQALYDWMEVNIGDVDGAHRQRIPDGKLCSAGRDKYAAFDRPGDWPLTHLQPNSAGQYDVVYTSTAPHATAYYRLLITRAGFDARTDTLRWADLEPVYDSGPRPAAAQNHFSVALPARSEPAILYTIWQRSDSPEAFYACSDVTVGGGGSAPTAPPTTAPPPTPPTTAPATSAPTSPSTPPTSPTTPPATSAPTVPAPPPAPPTDPPAPGEVPDGSEPFSPVAGIVTSLRTTASWDTGRCLEVRVENPTSGALSWEVHFAPGGGIASLWNASSEEQDHEGHEGHVAFVGDDWNERLAPGRWTTFGMCVDT
jgi:chitin-binding protein